MADKLVFDQIAHARLPHAYQYRDTLIVLEGTAEVPARDAAIHLTFGDGRYQVIKFSPRSNPLPIEDSLKHAAERIDAVLETEPTHSFRRDHLEMQHNFLHGDLTLVG